MYIKDSTVNAVLLWLIICMKKNITLYVTISKYLNNKNAKKVYVIIMGKFNIKVLKVSEKG